MEEKRLLTEQEVIETINGLKKGVVVLDGPSGCGKTSIVNSISAPEKKKVFSAEFFTQIIDVFRRTNAAGTEFGTIVMETASEWAVGCAVLCFEDVDMMLRGRESTTDEMVQIINALSGDALVVATGIDIRNRVPGFIESLEAIVVDYQAGVNHTRGNGAPVVRNWRITDV